MIIHYQKKLICNKNIQVCCDNYYKTIQTICPEFKNSINGHITINHTYPYHNIELVFYTKSKHEFLRDGKTISRKFDHEKQEKYKGKLPTKSQLENL